MEKIGLGFIGCGGHAFSSHAKIAAAIPDMFSIESAFDVDGEASKRLAELRHGAHQAYAADSADDVFDDPEVDAVIIATPHKYHLKYCERAIKAHKHILCEKPLWEGRGVIEARGREALYKAMRRSLVFTSCHPRRFEPEYLTVKENMNRYCGDYGRIMEMIFRFFYHKPSTEWKKHDNLLLDHMNHEIDLANFLLGRSPVRLKKLINVYDRYQVVGSRDDGVNLCFAGYRRLESKIYHNELELIFEKGRVSIRSALKSGMVGSSIILEDFDRGEKEVFPQKPHSYEETFFGIMKNFGEAIRGAAKNYLTTEDLITNTVSCNTLVYNNEYRG